MILRELEILSFAGVDVVLSQRPKRLHLQVEIWHIWRGHLKPEVHADGALECGVLGGILAGRQAHRQRVGGQYREGLGFSDGQGGECPTLSSPYRLLLRVLMLTSVVGP